MRARWLVLGSAIVLTAAAIGYWAVFLRLPRADVDAAQEQAMRTSIDNYLEQHHWRGLLEDTHRNQKVAWFCADHLIETTQDQDRYRVGLYTVCSEFTVVNGSLVVGSGEGGAKLATVKLLPGSAEVLDVDSPPDGVRYSTWIRDRFSRAGVVEIHHVEVAGGLSDAANAKARKAFGLPADAPVMRPGR
jgi:predicted membrane-bound spermidine synthase